jgi:hypothetical protein
MKRILVATAAATALLVGTAGAASAGQLYGNYGQYDQGYGPPPAYARPSGGPHYAGPPPGYYGRDHYRRDCGGDRAAGTIIGGVLGGVIGNNVAGGRHRGPETVAGVILGGLLGNAIASGACRDRYHRNGYGYGDDAYASPYPGEPYDGPYGPRDGYGYDPEAPYSPGYGEGGPYDDGPYGDGPYYDGPYDER